MVKGLNRYVLIIVNNFAIGNLNIFDGRKLWYSMNLLNDDAVHVDNDFFF